MLNVYYNSLCSSRAVPAFSLVTFVLGSFILCFAAALAASVTNPYGSPALYLRTPTDELLGEAKSFSDVGCHQNDRFARHRTDRHSIELTLWPAIIRTALLIPTLQQQTLKACRRRTVPLFRRELSWLDLINSERSQPTR